MRKVKSKEEIISDLFIPEYRYPVFQEFLAELVYETRHLNKSSVKTRYENLLKIILGPLKTDKSRKAYQDDTQLLAQAASFMKVFKMKDSEACLEVSRLALIKGYKLNGGWRKNLDHNTRQNVNSMKRRLLKKFEQPDQHIQKSALNIIEKMLYHETAQEEADFVKSLTPNWYTRYQSK